MASMGVVQVCDLYVAVLNGVQLDGVGKAVSTT